ncbi:layilin isoform X2 [Pezoporus flaviventris]|uniref:layilin isoform X2 n=1 Tax=Pezoporus flaviventris TaxID=889875 RepID=UPI002AB06D34|nr:layilin isoform X2 [Pezoporus flaviventris]
MRRRPLLRPPSPLSRPPGRGPLAWGVAVQRSEPGVQRSPTEPGTMLAAAALCAAALGWAAGARLLSAVDISLRRGQTICRRGTEPPCYKIVYFHDASRRISYEEAQHACRTDGGHLVSIETEAEQRLIERFIDSLLASDGDFWIGLRRKKEVDNSTDCQNLYFWSDGSSSNFRNWYVDEPSCGSEICVVMYYQPSAPPGVGGPYMFQWNDDRCNMKNNFICKYSLEKTTRAPIENSQKGVATEPLNPLFPKEHHRKDANVTLVKAQEPVQSLAYILIPSIPVLLLLIVVIGIFWFWLVLKRQEQIDASPKEEDAWLSNHSRNSPNMDIYKVIKKQSEADLAGTRPDTKNSSFRKQEDKVLDSFPSDYSGAATNTSSGFVTLTSTESGFVTNDIYEMCGHHVGRSKESAWVENEIYGY